MENMTETRSLKPLNAVNGIASARDLCISSRGEDSLLVSRQSGIIRDASGLGWRDAKCTMDFDEVVGESLDVSPENRA
jgi:hypothetical protein